ncbi:hypothetical protein ACHAW6_014877 [Cyclotella cf. meneghiniana]
MPPPRLLMTRGALLAALSFVSSISLLPGSHIRHNVVAFFPTSSHCCPRWRSPRHGVSHRSARELHQTSSSHSSSLESIAPRILAQSILPSVALILPLGVRNTTARGSGFVVDFNLNDKNNDHGEAYRRDVYLLTAAHVALPGHRIQVVFHEDRNNQNDYLNRESVSMPATVVGRNVPSDLALLRVHLDAEDFVPPPPLVLATQSTAAVGTPAYAMGYPSGGIVGPAMTSGIVCGNAAGLVTSASAGSRASEGGPTRNHNETSVKDVLPKNDSNNINDTLDIVRDEKTRYIVTDAAMAGGMSGGPLIDGSSGSVLGVNALINMELRALGNYAVSAAECNDFLKQMSLRLKGSAADGSTENSEKTTIYRVLLYNDRFNKRARVQDLLQKVAQLNATESNRIMMEAHTSGRGLIREFSGDNADANELCDALRKEDLLVEVEAVY